MIYALDTRDLCAWRIGYRKLLLKCWRKIALSADYYFAIRHLMLYVYCTDQTLEPQAVEPIGLRFYPVPTVQHIERAKASFYWEVHTMHSKTGIRSVGSTVDL